MGGRIRVLRGRRTVPQIAKLVADRIGSCDSNYLYKVEKAERSPGADLREAIAGALESTVEYIETGERPALRLAEPPALGALAYELATKYPKASNAARIAAQLGVPRAAIEAVLSQVHESKQVDHEEAEWIDKMKKRAKIDAEDSDAAAVADREKRDEAMARAQARKAKPRFGVVKRGKKK